MQYSGIDWTQDFKQFIYGTGIAPFCDRAAQLAVLYGPGFAITPRVKDAIVAHQPKY